MKQPLRTKPSTGTLEMNLVYLFPHQAGSFSRVGAGLFPVPPVSGTGVVSPLSDSELPEDFASPIGLSLSLPIPPSSAYCLGVRDVVGRTRAYHPTPARNPQSRVWS